MNKKDKFQKNILAYSFDLLDIAEKAEFESHLRDCASCRKGLERVRRLRDIQERGKSDEKGLPGDLSRILDRARREETAVARRTVSADHRPSGQRLPLFRWAAASALAAVVFGAVLVTVRNNTLDYLYLTRATGDVRLNDKPLFVPERFIYRVDLGRAVRIGVGEGECDFQVNRDKAFGMKSLTEVLVRGGREIVLDFIRGTLVAHAEQTTSSKPLKIFAPIPNAFFRVVGTKFFIQSTNRSVEFGVLEGSVEGNVSNRVFHIQPSEIIRVGEDFVQLLTNRSLAVTMFKGVDQFEIRKDFRNAKPIVIRTDPVDTEIYWKNRVLGRAPLFYLGERDVHKSVMIVKKGYVSREIEIGRAERYTIAMSRERDPEEIWKYRLPSRRIVNPVLTGDGALLLVDESGQLMKISLRDSKTLWTFPASARNNAQPVVDGDRIYFASADQNLYAIRAETGKPVWKTRVGILVNSRPQITDSRVFVCSMDGTVTVLDAANGSVVVQKKFDDGFYSSPLAEGGLLYFGGMKGTFYALDARTLEVRWKFYAGDRIVGSQPVFRDGRIFFGSNDRYLYALDAMTGKLAWKRYAGGEIFTSPVPLDDSILICTVKGDVYSLDRSTGEPLWESHTGSRILLDPVLSQNKYLFLVSEREIRIFNRWGLLFTKYANPSEITDYAVSPDKAVFVCGSDGTLRTIRFAID